MFGCASGQPVKFVAGQADGPVMAGTITGIRWGGSAAGQRMHPSIDIVADPGTRHLFVDLAVTPRSSAGYHLGYAMLLSKEDALPKNAADTRGNLSKSPVEVTLSGAAAGLREFLLFLVGSSPHYITGPGISQRTLHFMVPENLKLGRIVFPPDTRRDRSDPKGETSAAEFPLSSIVIE